MVWFWNILLKLTGWKVEGRIPKDLKKYIIAVAPHTSNRDFLIGLMVRGSMGFHANYLGKKSLFRFPHGPFFSALGGIPVDRSGKLNQVDQIVAEAVRRKRFGLAIAPEGTRKQVNQWKTGFYYIALKASIPIIPTQLDWAEKRVSFLDPFHVTGDIEAEMPKLRSLFEGIKGYADIHGYAS